MRIPVCVFVIFYGVMKLAELADWSRLHDEITLMLDVGPGTVTALLAAGKAGEAVLTVTALCALARDNDGWLLAVLVGWTADLAALSVIAGVYGDMGRLLEHGLGSLAFAGLLAATHTLRTRRTRPLPAAVPSSPYGSGLTVSAGWDRRG